MLSNNQTQTVGKRYIPHDMIGRGGMGAVFTATDRLTGRQVALKRVDAAMHTLSYIEDTRQNEFRLALANEFRLLASLRHPNIIEVLDYGFDTQRDPFFTMEYLENAQPILDAAYGQSLERKVNLIVQTLQALAYLHRRGILHRDLKPANVLVAGGSVKVLDFGLSVMRERNPTAEDSDTTVGTLAYMAPEILLSEPTTERADLYSIGVIAYEMLAGQHPFETTDIAELVNNVLYVDADINQMDVPLELAQIVMRLIAKSPDMRYGSAQEVIAAIREAVDFPIFEENAKIRESFLRAAQFVGRQTELQQLIAALARARDGEGSIWFVTGDSGSGKSRLLEELRTRALIEGIQVITGQGVGEASVPYQMWRMPFGWLNLLRDLSTEEISLIKAMIPDVPTVSDMEVSAAQIRSPHRAREQLLDIFRGTLDVQRSPFVLILEDLHWAGSESLALFDMLRNVVRQMRLLVVASFRDDHAPNLHKQFPGIPVIKLNRLSEEQILQLSEAMLGESGRRSQVVDVLTRETEGNILFIIEVIRALAEETGQLDQIGQTTLPSLIFEGGLRRIIQHRLEQLPESARVILRVAAVIGRQLDVELFRDVMPDVDIDRWLIDCVNAGILEVQGEDWRFAHDKLRDGVLEELTPQEREALHARVALAMEKLYGSDNDMVVPLAYHWRMAGNTEREQHYTALAGDQALLIGAYREAIEFFERALELVPAEREGERITLLHRLGQAHLGIGGYAEARNLNQRSIQIARRVHDVIGLARGLQSLGEIAYAQSDLAEARDLFEQARDQFQAAGDLAGLARSINSLGNVLYDTGDHNLAKILYQQSMQLAHEAGSQWGMAGAVRKVDLVTETSENPEQLLIALDSNLASNDLRATTEILTQISATREVSAARDALMKALQAGLDAGDHSLVLTTLLHISQMMRGKRRYEEALELLAVIIYAPESPDRLQDEAEAMVFELEALVDDALPIWDRGKLHTIASAAAAALGWMD